MIIIKYFLVAPKFIKSCFKYFNRISVHNIIIIIIIMVNIFVIIVMYRLTVAYSVCGILIKGSTYLLTYGVCDIKFRVLATAR